MSHKLVGSHQAGVAVSTTSQPWPVVPTWLPEAILFGEYWRTTGLLERLQKQVRISRGRMGHYEGCDFVLLLLAYAVSGCPSLSTFFAELAPVKSLLMGVWGRDRCPVASTLSRALAAIDEAVVEQLRSLFEADLLAQGVNCSTEVGLTDRCGQRYLVFDVDGTSTVVRHRSLPNDEHYPKVRRRSRITCAPGFLGRKRGDVIRTRSAIGQAHTQEWLGSFAAAGNGHGVEDLKQACGIVTRYLEHHQLDPRMALFRLDGFYGSPRILAILHQAQLGYLVRSKDYQLLKYPLVQQRIAQAVPQAWQHPETHRRSELLDIGWIQDSTRGYDQPTRLIVVRNPIPAGRIRIGKRSGDSVYELFMTTASAPGLTALDVLALYYGRGGFEKILADETADQDSDRWCSWQPHGQAFWQILNQWVWNWRITMGWRQGQAKVRQTLWSIEQEVDEAISAPSEVAEASAASLPQAINLALSNMAGADESSIAIYGEMQVAPRRGPTRNKFAGDDFKLVNEHTLICPAGHSMYPRERQVNRVGDLVVLFGLNPRTCQQCPLRPQCHVDGSKGTGGRRVSVIRRRLVQTEQPPVAAVGSQAPLIATPPLVATRAVIWCDIPSVRLRRDWTQQLQQHQIEIEQMQLQEASAQPSALITRHQRAHRRLSWQQRLKRNACHPQAPHWVVRVHGISQSIADALNRVEHQHFAKK